MNYLKSVNLYLCKLINSIHDIFKCVSGEIRRRSVWPKMFVLIKRTKMKNFNTSLSPLARNELWSLSCYTCRCKSCLTQPFLKLYLI